MRIGAHGRARRRGFSLIEAVVAVGVLAVVVPLVVAVMVRSSESAALARAENRAPAIVATCLDEVAAAREGKSRLFDPIADAGPFPAAGGLSVIGFTAEGRLAGRVEAAAYDGGLTELDGEPVRFLARVDGAPEDVRADARPMRSLRVSIEFPAAAPRAKRRKLEFYSRMP